MSGGNVVNPQGTTSTALSQLSHKEVNAAGFRDDLQLSELPASAFLGASELDSPPDMLEPGNGLHVPQETTTPSRNQGLRDQIRVLEGAPTQAAQQVGLNNFSLHGSFDVRSGSGNIFDSRTASDTRKMQNIQEQLRALRPPEQAPSSPSVAQQQFEAANINTYSQPIAVTEEQRREARAQQLSAQIRQLSRQTQDQTPGRKTLVGAPAQTQTTPTTLNLLEHALQSVFGRKKAQDAAQLYRKRQAALQSRQKVSVFEGNAEQRADMMAAMTEHQEPLENSAVTSGQ